MSNSTQISHKRVAEEYKRYGRSEVMGAIAQVAHGSHFCGQTSSATFHEIYEVMSKWPLSKDAVILDAGCGEGCFTFKIAEHFGMKTIGIDISEDLIEKGKKKSKNTLCQFIKGDYGQLPKEISCLDCILCIGSMYWSQSLDSIFQCWKERLKPKGKCLIFLNVCTCPLTESEQKRAGETRFFVEKDLLDKIDTYFTITNIVNQNTVYIDWLYRWCEGMKINSDSLIREFGYDAVNAMKVRFEAYLEYAICGKTNRLIIESEN